MTKLSRNLVFVGPPGSGKGTQAKDIAQAFGLQHISTGEVFRRHIDEKTELGISVMSYIADGRYVMDEIVNEIVQQELERTGYRNFILDGYPRNAAQTLWLRHALSQKGENATVLLFVASDRTVRERMLVRARADESLEVIDKRIALYHKEIDDVINLFHKHRDFWTMRWVDANKDQAVVYGDIIEQLT